MNIKCIYQLGVIIMALLKIIGIVIMIGLGAWGLVTRGKWLEQKK